MGILAVCASLVFAGVLLVATMNSLSKRKFGPAQREFLSDVDGYVEGGGDAGYGEDDFFFTINSRYQYVRADAPRMIVHLGRGRADLLHLVLTNVPEWRTKVSVRGRALPLGNTVVDVDSYPRGKALEIVCEILPRGEEPCFLVFGDASDPDAARAFQQALVAIPHDLIVTLGDAFPTVNPGEPWGDPPWADSMLVALPGEKELARAETMRTSNGRRRDAAHAFADEFGPPNRAFDFAGERFLFVDTSRSGSELHRAVLDVDGALARLPPFSGTTHLFTHSLDALPADAAGDATSTGDSGGAALRSALGRWGVTHIYCTSGPVSGASLPGSVELHVVSSSHTPQYLKVCGADSAVHLLPPARAAEIVSIEAPASVPVGSRFEVTITVRNTGRYAWDTSGGFELCETEQSAPFVTSSSPVTEKTVPSGASIAFRIPMTAPDKPRRQRSRWQMRERGGVELFGDIAEIRIDIVEAKR